MGMTITFVTERVVDEQGQHVLRVTSTLIDDGVQTAQRIDFCSDWTRVSLLRAKQFVSLVEDEGAPLVVLQLAPDRPFASLSLVELEAQAAAEWDAWWARWGLVVVHTTLSVLAIAAVAAIHFDWVPAWP